MKRTSSMLSPEGIHITQTCVMTSYRYHNLKMDKASNSLSMVERTSIWTPILIMDNTEQKLETLNDKATFIEARKPPSDLAQVQRRFLFLFLYR